MRWYNYENAFSLSRSNLYEDEKENIIEASFIESLQKQSDYKISKKVAGGWFDTYSIVLKEKKNEEDLFWSNF